MSISRRAVLASAALAPFSAHAQALTLPDWLRRHPALEPWDAPVRQSTRLLNARIEAEPGGPRPTIREWLGGRPGVLAVWATWCPPCLVEKRAEAELGARLEAAGSRTQIKALLAFDRTRLLDARRRLEQLRAGALVTARASEAAERSLLWTFGFDRDRRSMHRTEDVYAELATALPFTLLLDANGAILGTMVGAISDSRGRSYWSNPGTFDMLQRLGEA